MGSVFGGPQTIPTTQNTAQSISQAGTQQQAAAQAAQQQQTQTIQPGPQAQNVGNMIGGYAQDIASGFNPVPGALQIAPLTEQQNTGINALFGQGMGMQGLVGQGQGYLGQGTGLMGTAGQGITANDINAFYNPMAANVTAQMQNIFGQQNLANRLGATSAIGGIGGDRAAVAQGILANQQGLAAGQTYANLYQQALQAAQQQKAQQLGAGQALAGTGFQGMQAGFGGLGTALQAATIPQQQQQQALAAQYQAAQQAYQDPFMRMQALAGMVAPLNQAYGITTAGTGQQTGISGGQLASTLTGQQLGQGVGTTTYPAPSILSQVAGLGTLGVGLAGLLSDRRAKTDIQKVGTHSGTGLPLYAYRYKGDPKTYPKVVGPMAQDVAKHYPGAVQKLQSGGAVMPPLSLPTGADLQARISPLLAQAQSTIPQLMGQLHSLGGGSSLLGGGASAMPAAQPAATTGVNPYSWGPGGPAVTQNQQALLAAQPASFWQGVNPQNMGMGRAFFGGAGPGSAAGMQTGGAVDADDDSDSEPDSDTDDTSSAGFSLNKDKIQKGVNLLNQYARSSQQKTPQAVPIKFPAFNVSMPTGQITPAPTMPAMALAASGMQQGGSTDDSGGKTVQSADSDLASLRFETMANLAQGREVPPFQKGFQEGGEVESPQNDGEDDGGEDTPLPTPRPTGAAPAEAFGPPLPRALPRGRMLPGPVGGMGGLGGFAQSPYMALTQAGLGMLAASGQRDARGLPMSPLGAIGAGGMAGMNTLQQQQQFGLKQRLADQAMGLKWAQLNALEGHRRALESVPRIIGTDENGFPVRGIYNSQTGKWDPVPEVGGASQPSAAAIASPEFQTATQTVKTPEGAEITPAEEKIPENARLAEGELESQSANPDYLKTLDPKEAGIVKGIAEGRIPITSLSRFAPQVRLKILKEVNTYDPSYSAARVPLRNSYLGGGKGSQMNASFDMTMQHVGRLLKSSERLQNYNVAPQYLNAPYNWFRENLGWGQDKMAEFQAAKGAFLKDRDAVAAELMRATRGTGAGTLEEIRHWREGIDANSSPIQTRAAAQEAIQLLAGRINAQGNQWNQGMGVNKDPLSWLSPEAKKMYDFLGEMDPKIPVKFDKDGMPYQTGAKHEGEASKPFDAGAPTGGGEPARPQSESEYEALPSGAQWIDKDGNLRKKR